MQTRETALPRPTRPTFWQRLSGPQLIALTFAAAILIGALLLWLPLTHQAGQTLTFVQAVFMSTSAVCVTGLAVVDPGSTFNLTGQVVLLLLIQLGGLGLVTLGTLFAITLRRRVSITERIRAAEQTNATHLGEVLVIVRTIVLLAAGVELVGALLLAPDFIRHEGVGRGLYFALFHSVSAFNNAGFSLYKTGLAGFVTDPWVNLVIPLLIILGGLGFLVQMNVLLWLQNPRRNRLSVNTKLSLTMTAILLAVGILTFALLEWNNSKTLGNLTFGQKIMASVFQGVTPRTAGFNTLQYVQMKYTTLFIAMLLMFIGANSGSTGGGIKANTFSIMAVSAWSLVRGHSDIHLFRRRISLELVLRALTVTLLSAALVLVGFTLMLYFNTNVNLKFHQLLFETISAFATVGLSMDTTPLLNANQELVLIALMFFGRIGPLTFAVAFTQKRAARLVNYPAERDVLVG